MIEHRKQGVFIVRCIDCGYEETVQSTQDVYMVYRCMRCKCTRLEKVVESSWQEPVTKPMHRGGGSTGGAVTK